jgi:alkane 1-monooxygenase
MHGSVERRWQPGEWRFAFAWALPLAVAAGAAHSGWAAWAAMAGIQITLALSERVPALRRSPPPTLATAWHRACVRAHVPLQLALMGWALAGVATRPMGWAEVAALGLAVGGISGSQGITFAHDLGHSRRRLDRALAWVLMGSVGYAHFMVEHYRGHHVRVATAADPASARRGESLWRFLPRTLAGSWRSAWALEAARLQRHGLRWRHSVLAWALASQAVLACVLLWALGPKALLWWVVQAAYAVFLLETVNYVEHYGLQRRVLADGRAEPVAAHHAWGADALLTNCVIANLQRHADHHLHPGRPYAELQPLPGPQLPTGYAGCLFLAAWPRLWFRLTAPRLAAWDRAAAPAATRP